MLSALYESSITQIRNRLSGICRSLLVPSKILYGTGEGEERGGAGTPGPPEGIQREALFPSE